MDNQLPAKIESLLFYAGEPVSIKRIAEYCDVSPAIVTKALKQLKEELADRGVTVIVQSDQAQLTTAPAFSEFITSVREAEINTDLTTAQSEALAVIAYLAPVKKVKIDFIRGVNSRAVLRNLSARGLITSRQEEGVTVYDLTGEALAHLGITSVEELPDYAETREQLAEFTESEDILANLEEE